jgi:nitronate monooxygenase
MTLAPQLASRLRLPLICAPMFRVSGPDLVIAACRAGVIGAFPTANCRSLQELDQWLVRLRASIDATHAPFCPNLIMRRTALKEELACLVRHRVEMVITSVGSPAPVIPALRDIGCSVWCDVASVRHAEKAVEAGVDGLILLSAGAGGQTGWANPFAFVRAVRSVFDGPIVLAGGMSDGRALWAARALGCDLAYMGTRFIATHESMAAPEYRQMLVDSDMDDVMLTSAFTGLEASILRPSVVAAGMDPQALPDDISEERASQIYGSAASPAAPRRWKDVWTAGHSVSGVTRVLSVADLVHQVQNDYEAARTASRGLT